MQTVELVAWILRALMLLVGAAYFYQLVYLVVPFVKKARPHGEEKRLRYAVLIAARNEASVLPYLLDSIRQQDYPAELVQVYVCADNCTDQTAAVAAKHGAVVFERSSQTQIGKGYALRYLLEHINPESYDACLVFDADNLLCRDYISCINRSFSDGYEAVCGYRNSKNFVANWISYGYALWYIHDSVHLNRSRMLLGVSCAVNGTGFGFTRALVQRCGGWSFFTLTEDIEFDNWCAVNGVKIGFCGNAMVYDEQPTDFVASWRQRTRWMQGSIQLTILYGWQLLKNALARPGLRYTCYETLTLTILGYGVSVLLSLANAAFTFLTVGMQAGLWMLAGAAASGYLGMLAIGALTLAGEWSRIHGDARKKLGYLFTFPLFMMTYIPIAVCAPFQRFQWKETMHDVGMSLENIEKDAG